METETNEQQASLWADLEGEFQAFDARPTALPSGKAPDRRLHRLGERFPQAVFNGFVPTVVLCLLAALLVVPDWSSILSVAVTLLVAIPLALIVAPLVARIRPVLLAAVAFLIGGTVNLVATGLDSGRVMAVHNTTSPLENIALFQEAMETTFSWPFFSLLVLAGLAVSSMTSVYIKKRPWRDVPARGLVRLSLAWIVATTPLILVGVCLLINLLNPPSNALWLSDIQREYPRSFAKPNYGKSDKVNRWNELLTKWNESISLDAVRVPLQKRIAATPPEAVRALETEFLTLWQGEKEETWYASILALVFLEKHQELQNPVEMDLALVELAFEELQRGDHSSGFAHRSFVQLIDTLSETQLSAAQLERVRNVVAASRKRVLDPVADMDRIVAAGLRWYVVEKGRSYPRPLKLFGFELQTSPTALWIEHRHAATFSSWTRLRKDLMAVEPEGRLEYLRSFRIDGDIEEKSMTEQMIYGFSRSFFSQEMDAYLQTAELLVNIRLHKLEKGEWPTDLSELDPQLSDRWRLEQSSEGLTLIDNGLPAGEKSAWVLK